MKQNLLKTVLLLCALVAGMSSAWADTTYKLTQVTSVSAGNKYVFVRDGHALSNSVSSKALQTVSNYSTTGLSGTEAYVWTLESATGGFYLKNASLNSNQYLNNASDKTDMSFGSKNAIWSIAFTNSEALISNTSNSNRFLGDAGGNSPNHTYKAYATSNLSNYQHDFTVYILEEAAVVDPTITFNNGSVRVGKTLDLSNLFSSNSSGTVTYSITAGDSYATLEGSTLTATAVGSVTVQASQAATSGYNAKVVTATITVNEAATLSSIAITTAPTKTTYIEGESFSTTGMVVTATYSDSSTDDVTASCTWTPSGALTASDTEITVRYTEDGVNKTATQSITVNEYTQPVNVTIDMNYTWLGTEKTESLTTGDLPFEQNDDNVTTTITEGSSNQPRGDDTYIRVYGGSQMTFEAPTGYVITAIAFTTGGDDSWKAPTVGGESLSGKTWTGCASSVAFTMTGKCFIASVDITLAVKATLNSFGFATFASRRILDFTDNKEFSAWQITGISGSTIFFSQIKGAVAAGTGVLLQGTASATIGIPVAESGTDISATNKLEGITASTDVAADEYYGLRGNEFVPVNAGTVPAGKALLPVSAVTGETKALTFIFSDASGIDTVREMNVNDGAIYNPAGQKMQKLQKGINIVNGKKVFVK